MKQKFLQQAINFFLTCFVCIFLRSALVNLPNIEPILGLLICVSKSFNFIELFLFGFLNILFFDLVTFNFGIWTIFTAISYALIGTGTYLVKTGKVNYLQYSIISTIVYDIITGLVMGPILFNQDFMEALIGQMPFTMYHIIGNLVLTIMFTYLLELFFVVKSSILLKGEKYYHVR